MQKQFFFRRTPPCLLSAGGLLNSLKRLGCLQYFLIWTKLEIGGLLSYGVDTVESFRSCADFVDKILNGAKPGDLPVEFPTKLYLAVNLRTAKAIGLTISKSFLLLANEVIE